MKLTDRLDQIDRLDQQTTPGPWAVWSQLDENGTTYPEYIEGPKNDLFGERGWDDKHYIQEIPELTMDDAEFIALSRTALPAMAKALQNVLGVVDTVWDQVNNPVNDEARNLVRDAIHDAITDAMGAVDAG